MNLDPMAEPARQESAERERLYIEMVRELEAQLRAEREEIQDLKERVSALSKKQAADRKTLRRHEARLGRLRLDRQLVDYPRWLARKVKRQLSKLRPPSLEPHEGARAILLLSPTYPSEDRPYGGQPIYRRVRYYQRAGYDVTVFVPSVAYVDDRVDGVRVIRGKLSGLPKLVSTIAPDWICLHHPEPDVWRAVRPFVDSRPVAVWVHGYEARDWRALQFNFSADELASQSARLDAINIARQQTLAEIFRDERLVKVFVSEFMREVAEEFAGCKALNGFVIHNVIDTATFAYHSKEVEQRNRVLTVRSFAARNYATDLVAQVILRLSEESEFDDLSFVIQGDGRYFDADTASLRQFANVDIRRGIVSSTELARLHKEHGVMLLPTRWDSQGMTMGEAMASGMVVVSNEVAAIPEFADTSCAALAPPEDVEAMAQWILRLYREPVLFGELSESAAARAASQCGPQATVERELVLLETAWAGTPKGDTE